MMVYVISGFIMRERPLIIRGVIVCEIRLDWDCIMPAGVFLAGFIIAEAAGE